MTVSNTEDWELVDYLRWRTAVLDISSIDVDKIRAGNIDKGAAFICYHALGHMTGRAHSDVFLPTGFMSKGQGVFHILGTEELSIRPELFNLYNTLEDLINDPNNKFDGTSQKFIKNICDLF